MRPRAGGANRTALDAYPHPRQETPVPDLAIDPEQRPPYRRRWLLRAGAEAGWWTYESENAAGVPVAGVTYDETSYTIKLPAGPRVTIVAGEVEGWVTREAVLRDDVNRIRYRRGLPGDPE
jgi:hypothetical protein